jgi:hypothetical protein
MENSTKEYQETNMITVKVLSSDELKKVIY